MQIRVFKFGGAALATADGIRNVARIITRFKGESLLVIVSAMGKTTNAMEEVLDRYMQQDPLGVIDSFNKVRDYHAAIVNELFPDPDHPVHGEVGSLFDQLRGYIRRGHLYIATLPDRDFEYDQMVSYGELIASSIVTHFLLASGLETRLFDVRDLVLTNTTYRDARVDWETTRSRIEQAVPGYFVQHPGGAVALTQGFIGSDPAGNTTTLGREGSDFTAAIFAFCLKAGEMTIWKDVPGVMNADPKYMPDAVRLDTLSYREAIELAYYGASVIHPKTIKPLENANITLRVRSFLDPDLPGTTVENIREWKIGVPIFIRKKNQVLISLSPRDFSFILEENLSHIFSILASFKVKVNIMQNSAISFSFCIDNDPHKVTPLIEYLRKEYETRYNTGLELHTIRHYTEDSIRRVIQGRKVLVELRSRNTYQGVVRESPPGSHT